MIRTVVPMFAIKSGVIEFEVIVYNRTAAQLSTVPNEIIHSLARRFPQHTSTPFALYELEDKKSVRTSGRRFK